jgi:hypothetical protein
LDLQKDAVPKQIYLGMCDTQSLNRTYEAGRQIGWCFDWELITGQLLALQEQDNLKIHDASLRLPIVKDAKMQS